MKKGLTAEENKIPSFDQAKEKYFGVIKIKNKSSELLATRAFKGILQFKTIRSLDELNLEFLEAFLQSLIGKYKPSTIKNNIWVINDFLSYCEDRNWIANHPTINSRGKSLLTLPRLKGSVSKPRIFSKELLGKLFAHPNHGQYYQWLYYTGLRAADCALLTWENVNVEKRTLTAHIKKSKRTRVFGLHPFLAEIARKAKSAGASGYIFPQFAKVTIPYQAPYIAFVAFLKKEGISQADEQGNTYRLHSFRATCAQHVLKNSNSIDAAKQLGHSSDKTINEYTVVDPEVSNRILDSVETINIKYQAEA